MKAVTGKQMGLIDKYSIEQIGIPGVVLMENAALKVVKNILDYFEKKPDLPKDIVIVTGKGNNAGDAFAVARHLKVSDIRVKLYCLFSEETIYGDARSNFDILKNIGISALFLDENSELGDFSKDIKNTQLVLDAIFGTGFKGEIQGHIADVIAIINKNSRYIMSVDIASGIDASTGKVAKTCIKAHKTITFELPKIGQLIYPGLQFTGDLVVESINIPMQSINCIDVNTILVDKDLVKGFIPKRNSDFNKGNCGKVIIIAGSIGMAGAGCLTAKASLKTGSGLVSLAGPSRLINVFQSVVPEAIAINLEDSVDTICEKSIRVLTNTLNKADVVAVGPGISNDKGIYNVIETLADEILVPVVLDADALNAVANDTTVFNKFKKDVVVTPHPGEMSRLTGLDISYIQQNRIAVAREYAMQWEVVVLLKGSRTIVADKNGDIFINPTGNSGMATAGSGDSLTGIISSLMGQGASALEAAVAGAYIHGLAGDIAASSKGEYGMTAMDIVDNIPFAITKLII